MVRTAWLEMIVMIGFRRGTIFAVSSIWLVATASLAQAQILGTVRGAVGGLGSSVRGGVSGAAGGFTGGASLGGGLGGRGPSSLGSPTSGGASVGANISIRAGAGASTQNSSTL